MRSSEKCVVVLLLKANLCFYAQHCKRLHVGTVQTMIRAHFADLMAALWVAA